MCNWMSGIIVAKNKKVLWHPDIDSHTELLEHFKLKDETNSPNFVRVEFSPEDGDFLNHDFAKWKFKTDQDFKPDWYDKEKAKDLMLSAAKKMISDRFVSGKIKEIKEGRWFLKDADLEKASGSAILRIVNNSQVGELRENSQVGELRGNSQVGVLWGNSQVGELRGNSQVGELR